jgi:TP901 family phage tail tape measure protein
MAQSVISLAIQLNTSQAEAAVSTLKKTVSDIAKQDVFSTGGADKLNQAIDSIQNSFKKSSESARSALDNQKQIVAAMIQAGDTSGKAFANAKAELQKTAKAAKEFEESMRSADAIANDLGESTGGVSGAIGKWAQPLHAAQIGIGFIGSALEGTLKPAVDFEKSLAEIQAITGVSGAGLTDLGERAKNLAKTFGGDVTAQMDSFKGILSRFGPEYASNAEALGSMALSVNTLSKAAGLDAAQSMDALTNTVLQFDLLSKDGTETADNMARVMNTLAKGAQVGAAEVPQVAQAIVVAGSAAKSANVSLEETNAAIQVLAAKSGKYGSEAGVALRNVIGLMQKNSGEAESLTASLGVPFSELGKALQSKGLAGALELLNSGLNKIGSASERNAALMQIFGTENAGFAKALMANTDTLKDYTAQVTGTNSAVEQAEIVMNTTAEAVERFKASVQVMSIEAFGAFNSALGTVLVNLPNLIQGMKDYAVPIGFIGAGIGAIAIASNAALIAEKARAAYNIVSTGITTALATAQAALNAVMMANPYVLVAAGIAAAGAALAIYLKATEKTAEKELELQKTQEKSLSIKKESLEKEKTEIQQKDDLVLKYQALASKTTLTAKEQKELTKVQGDLAKAYPGVISGTASLADNMKALDEAGKASQKRLGEINGELKGLDEQIRANRRTQIFIEANIERSNIDKALQSLKSIGVFGGASADELAKINDVIGKIYTTEDSTQLLKLGTDLQKVLGESDALKKNNEAYLQALQAAQNFVNKRNEALAFGKKKEEEINNAGVESTLSATDVVRRAAELFAALKKSAEGIRASGVTGGSAKKQLEKEVKEIEGAIERFDDKKLAAQYRDKINELFKEEKKKKTDKPEEVGAKLKAQLEEYKAREQAKFDVETSNLEEARIKTGRIKSNDEDAMELSKRKIALLEKERKEYENIYKFTRDGDAIIIPTRLAFNDGENRKMVDDAVKQIRALDKQIQDAKTGSIKLDAKIKEDALEKIKKDLSDVNKVFAGIQAEQKKQFDATFADAGSALSAVLGSTGAGLATSAKFAVETAIKFSDEARNARKIAADKELADLQEKFKNENLGLQAAKDADLITENVFLTKKKALQDKFNQDEENIKEKSTEYSLALVADALGASKGLFAEQTAAYKAMAITEASIATYLAATKALTAGPVLGPILAALTIAAGLANVAKIAGFRKGGYTGDGGADDTAGIVHKGEFVFTKDMTARNRAHFEKMHKERLSMDEYAEKYLKLSQYGVVHINNANRTDTRGIEQRLDTMISRLDRVESAQLRTAKRFESLSKVEVKNDIVIKDKRRTLL